MPVWAFFNAHPVVFVVSLALVLLTLAYLVRLLVFNAGPDSEFRLGFLGLEYRRGQARARPRRPGLFQRVRQALKNQKPRVNDRFQPALEGGGEQQKPSSRVAEES